VEYKADIDQSPEKHTEFIHWLTQITVTSLRSADSDPLKLRSAIQQYINAASSSNLQLEEIENILGVNEPSIMDLAELSDADEEIVIDAFEQLTNI
jgi:hypothetical protein